MTETEAWLQLLYLGGLFLLIYPVWLLGKKLGSYIGLWILIIIYFAKGGKVHVEGEDENKND